MDGSGAVERSTVVVLHTRATGRNRELVHLTGSYAPQVRSVQGNFCVAHPQKQPVGVSLDALEYAV